MLTMTHVAAVLALVAPLGAASGIAPSVSGTVIQPESEDLPTAEALFDAHIEATGGMSAHESHQTRVLDGVYRILTQNETQIIRVFAAAPDKFRAELESPALGTTIRCTNGDVAWGMNLSGKPFRLGEREQAEIMDNAVFLGEAAYKDRYTSIVTESKAKIDNRDAYRVEFETRTGVKGAVYFDIESSLLVAREVVSERDPNMVSIVEVSQYRESDGVLMPMMQRQRLTTQSTFAVEIEFNWIKNNVEIVPSFDPPAALADSAEG